MRAQESVWLLAVPAHGSAKSDIIALGPNDEIAIDLPPDAAPSTSVTPYVHGADGTLVCADDPEVVATVFTCRPSATGGVYALVHNPGNVDARVRIVRRQTRAAPTTAANYATVRVLYATNRSRTAVGGSSSSPSSGFSSEATERLTHGYADVSIPRDHRMGELEGPSIFRLELRADPERHVSVLRTEVEDEARFLSRIRARRTATLTPDILVFVHGFNVAFDDAVRRTAQISYDLGFAGTPMAFSWPSHASPSPLGYQADVRNADLSAQQLASFLARLKASFPDVNVHVIAHSMGNRVLASALSKMERARTIGQVAMIAPDVDAALFRQLAPDLASKASRITLYASSADVALGLSNAQAGYARAGQSGDDLVVVPGVDTVDASDVPTSTIGLFHSYYADNATMLGDLFNVIKGVRPDDRFGIVRVSDRRGTFWRFRPAAR